MTRQRFMFARGISGGSGAPNDETTVFITSRARQILHLTGYRLFVADIPDLDALNDSFSFHVLLQTQERRWNVAVGDAWLSDIVALGGSRVIDMVQSDIVVRATAAANNLYVLTGNKETAWVECDLLVPQLALYAQLTASPAVSGSYGCIIEYEWISASPASIAAVFLNWGVDPVDFDRQTT